MHTTNKPTGTPHQPNHPAVTTGARPEHNGHDFRTCDGCDYVMDIHELSAALREPLSTLYKKSTYPFPNFPRRIRGRRTVAVRCRAAKAYLVEVER